MDAAEHIQIETDDHYRLPLQLYRANRACEITMVILPALGIAAKFYARVARSLNAHGFDVVVMEQRGHGASPLRASRHNDFGFREWLIHDIPATLDWVWQNLSGNRRYLLGHSLGGHLGAMACGLYPDRVDGLVLSACASPWISAYPINLRIKLRILSGVVRYCAPILGYYPGSSVGFGGREARTLMHDWRHMVHHNRYFAAGLDSDIDAAVNAYAGPVLSVRYAADSFAPEAATNAVTNKFSSAQLSHMLITSDAYTRPADHYQWAREPDVISQAIASWVATQ